MKLTVGTNSSWSLRAWICCQLAEIHTDIEVIDLTLPNYKRVLKKHSKTALVPVLSQDDWAIHDSLAIAEYLNECANHTLYPDSLHERAQARSLCLELHSGFAELRTHCPFSLVPTNNMLYQSKKMSVELSRIEAIFNQATVPFMFESAGIVDAFYAILAFRLKSYGIKFNGKAGAYQQSLINWPLLQQAITLAKSW